VTARAGFARGAATWLPRRRGRLAALLACAVAALAQARELPPAVDAPRWVAQADTVFRHFPANEMQYVQALAQDGQGFLWLATESGLTRWDGYRSRTYQSDPQDPSALPDNRVLALLADPRGRLWVGTGVGGLARYDPRCDCFSIHGTGPAGLANPSVSAIAADGRDGLWVGTAAGLDHFDPDTGAVRHVALGAEADGAVLDVLQDGSGALWLGTERGLFRRPPGGERFAAVRLDAARDSAMPVPHLRLDGSGRLWVAARSHGVFVIEPGQVVPHAVHGGAGAPGLEVESVRAIVEARQGEVWLGTAGGGIVVVEPDAGWRTRRLRHHVALATSLPDDDISSMLRDRGGLVWVGSTTALNMHDPRQVGVATLFGSTTRDRAVASVQVPFVMAGPGDRLWLSEGDGGGVEILDPLRGRVGELRPDPEHPRSALPRGRVLSMATAPGGDVYIATRQGLYRVAPRDLGVTRVEVPTRAADGGAWVLCFDKDVLWMGGADGLWALDVRDRDRPAVLRHEGVQRFGSQRVTTILRGRGDTLWVGTAAGVNRVELGSGRVERLRSDAADPGALLAGFVASMLLDARGRLWVASVGSGIQVLERQDADGRTHFRRLGTREGLPHNGVDMLLQDERGTVWASTDQGLAAIDPATFEVRTFGEAQGVAIERYWSNSGARTRAGELVFGGQGGLTVLRPDRVRPVDAQAPLVVTELRGGGRALPASSFNVDAGAPRVQLPAGDRSLSVEFAALDFTAPGLNRYSYRLQGFDSDWVATDAGRRLATYTNLPPGDYVLQLRGSGHAPPWTGAMREIAVSVLPAWYQTLWARLGAVLAALAALVATVQLRTAFLRRHQRELQQLVAIRTAELELRGEELRRSQHELEQIAYLDPLTGLANRRRFDEHLRQTLARALRGIGCATLLLIDLDLFKEINDTLGHDAGDALLVEVARRLTASVREADCVARLGGDEFAVLLAQSDETADVDAICGRILLALAQPFVDAGRTLRTSASLGVARCPGHATTADALYKLADTALYDAKRAGRNTWRVHGAPAHPAGEPAPREFAVAASACGR